MPRRGYRKGISDAKQPRPHVLKSRASVGTYQVLQTECASRSMTLSALIAALLDAHARRARLELPQARGPAHAALRELNRIGNNLNLIAKQANLLHLHLIEAEARRCLADVLDAVRRL